MKVKFENIKNYHETSHSRSGSWVTRIKNSRPTPIPFLSKIRYTILNPRNYISSNYYIILLYILNIHRYVMLGSHASPIDYKIIYY